MNVDADAQLNIANLYQIDAHTLGVDWSDGRKSRYRLSHLRRNCPCAACVDEWSGKPLLKAEAVDEDISATSVESVGRYAISIQFADGHTTGIYSFDLLRKLDEDAEATGASSS